MPTGRRTALQVIDECPALSGWKVRVVLLERVTHNTTEVDTPRNPEQQDCPYHLRRNS